MADDEHGDPLPFRQLHKGHGTLLHLGHTARGAGILPVVHGLDGVHDEHVGPQLGHRFHDVLQVGLGQQVECIAPHAQPVGSQLDLPLRLLTGDIEHLGALAQALANLEHQRGLADTGGAAHQHQGALDRSPAQHPVQLAQAGLEPELIAGLHLADGLGAIQGHAPDGAPGRGGGRAFFGLRRLLHHCVPAAAGGALPHPFRGLISAFRTVKYRFRLQNWSTSLSRPPPGGWASKAHWPGRRPA